MGSLAKALNIKEIAIDGNPVTLIGEFVSFLASYLPNLQIISTMHINEHIRRAATAWRTSKEQSNSAFLNLSSQVCINVRREEVISNAKTNWELLRSQTRCFASSASIKNLIKSENVRGLQLLNSNKLETVKLKGLHKTKSKVFGSLNSINEKVEAKNNHLKKRSKSIDNIINLDSANKINPLEFKLPPVLFPIIHNLARNKASGSFETHKASCLQNNDVDLSSDDERDSSESHEKSGLRSQLINANHRATTCNCEKSEFREKLNETDYALAFSLIKDGTHEQIKSLFSKDQESDNNEGIFNATVRSFLNQEDKVDCLEKSALCFPRLHSLNSKTSSIDSFKSVLGDSGSSSLSKSLDSKDEKYGAKCAQIKKIMYYKTNRAAGAFVKYRVVPAPSSQPQLSSQKEREQGGDYLIEINGRCLNVYGQGALSFIDRPWDSHKARDVNVVKFNYVQFNGVATILNKMKNRFPNTENYIFKETNISYLGQLNALAEVQGLNSIRIEAEGNPIISKSCRLYSVFRLAHWGLKLINEKEIAEKEIETAAQEYSGLADIVMRSLPESLLQPLLQRLHLEKAKSKNGEQHSAKKYLFDSDPTLRNVVAKEALQWRRGNITQVG